MIYLGMQIMVEGLALAAFGMMKFMNPHERLLHQITDYGIRDEARHVAFGVLSLEHIYRSMTSAELREREEFVIEAAQLMRDRLLMPEVWERLGYDVDKWTRWAGVPPDAVREDRPQSPPARPAHAAGPPALRLDRGAALRGPAGLVAGRERD